MRGALERWRREGVEQNASGWSDWWCAMCGRFHGQSGLDSACQVSLVRVQCRQPRYVLQRVGAGFWSTATQPEEQ